MRGLLHATVVLPRVAPNLGQARDDPSSLSTPMPRASTRNIARLPPPADGLPYSQCGA